MMREFPMSVILATIERGGEEDILGSQVPVYDGRGSVMEVEQSTGYILKDRAFEGEREVRHVFQEVIKASL